MTWTKIEAFGAMPLVAVPHFDHLAFAFSPDLIIPFAVIAMGLALMPRAVMGGVTLFTGGLIMVNGLQTMTSCPLDVRRTVVIGLGMIAGLGAEKYPHLASGLPLWAQAVTNSSFVLGTLVAMAANLLLPMSVSFPAVEPRAQPASDC